MLKTFFLSSIITIIFFSRPAFSQQAPFHPLRITDAIMLDGKLDDPEWQLAPVISDFMQTGPSPGAAPTEKTEVRVMYNDEYLYVGFRCYDDDPSKILQLRYERDFNLGDDDATTLLLDTYHDKNTAVCFGSNVLGARWDCQITGDGGSNNIDYNTFWDVATTMDSLGYTTVYRVPWSSLRFQAKPLVIMGIRFARLVRRKNELTTYPRMNPKTQNGWENVSFARDIEFDDLISRKPFYITPYVIADYSEQNVLNNDGTAYENNSTFITRKNFVSNEAFDKILSNIGVDMKYGISKNFTLDATLNTDFAQTEVDDLIINLTKYAVNLPEKRSFFLESANNLTCSFPTGDEIFVSRNIGNEKGVIVPIIAGIRLTGKTNGWQLGMLDMETAGIAADSISPHNFFVFRTRRDIDRLGSFVGAVFTNRINTDSSHLSNQSFGIDYVKRFTQQLTLAGGIVSTLVNGDFKPIVSSTYFTSGIFQSSNTGFVYSCNLDLVGKNFNPVMGYLDESNHGLVSTSFGYHYPAKETSKAEYWSVNTDESYRWILSSGAHETVAGDIFPDVTFRNGAEINFSLFDYKIDSLGFNWNLDDHNAIARGTYKMFNSSINLYAPSNSNYSASLNATYGGFYGGTRLYISPNGSYSFNKHFSVGITYQYNHIDFSKYLNIDSNTVYKSNLVRLSVAYIFSTKFSLKLYTQFDDLSNVVSSNLRFRYNPKEGTDLYIVIDQGLNSSLDRLNPHLPLLDSQEFTIKYLKTFGI